MTTTAHDGRAARIAGSGSGVRRSHAVPMAEAGFVTGRAISPDGGVAIHGN